MFADGRSAVKNSSDPPERLSDSTAAFIARQIESGQLQPGQRLQPERQLAEDLGVSRTAIREAFKQLQALGLVEAHVGRGRFVTEGAADNRSHFLAGQLFELHKNELSELSEVRELLESAAVRKISKAECNEIASKLRTIIAQARQALAQDDLTEVARLDSEFHATPLDYCPNRSLRVLATGVMVAMGGSVRSVLAERARATASLSEHERIVDAFEDCDPELAAALIGYHQSSSYRRSLDAIASGLTRDHVPETGNPRVG